MDQEIKLGKYIILKELGRGGYGVVYETQDSILGRKVALKVLHPNLVNDFAFVNRFRHEAMLASQLDHPNIVPIHDFDQQDGRFFIAMGLMERGSLKDYLNTYGAMAPSQVKTLLEQVSSGIGYAHEHDIIHRDLKPGNILIDSKGVARVADFGFAKALSGSSMSMSVSGGMLGTPAYMAPEVWEGKPASPASDIYSLGCIAYETLSGNQLFDGETPAQIMHAHLVRGPLPLEGASSAWQDFLNRCLDRDPSKRYPSANALLEDLRWGVFDVMPEHEHEIELDYIESTLPNMEVDGAIERIEYIKQNLESISDIDLMNQSSDTTQHYFGNELENHFSRLFNRQDSYDLNHEVSTGQTIEFAIVRKIRTRKILVLVLTTIGFLTLAVFIFLKTIKFSKGQPNINYSGLSKPDASITLTASIDSVIDIDNKQLLTETMAPTSTSEFFQTYVVMEEESCLEIATKFDVKVNDIIYLNGWPKWVCQLSEGEEIKIPRSGFEHQISTPLNQPEPLITLKTTPVNVGISEDTFVVPVFQLKKNEQVIGSSNDDKYFVVLKDQYSTEIDIYSFEPLKKELSIDVFDYFLEEPILFGWISYAKFSHDGKYFMVRYLTGAFIFETTNWDFVIHLADLSGVTHTSFLGDSHLIFNDFGGGGNLYDPVLGRNIASFSTGGKFISASEYNFGTLSEDGNKYAWHSPSDDENIIRVWNPKTQEKLFNIPIPANSNIKFSFSPDSNYLIFSISDLNSKNNTLHVYDLTSQQRINAFSPPNTNFKGFSANNNLRLYSRDNKRLYYYNFMNGQLVKTLDFTSLNFDKYFSFFSSGKYFSFEKDDVEMIYMFVD